MTRASRTKVALVLASVLLTGGCAGEALLGVLIVGGLVVVPIADGVSTTVRKSRAQTEFMQKANVARGRLFRRSAADRANAARTLADLRCRGKSATFAVPWLIAALGRETDPVASREMRLAVAAMVRFRGRWGPEAPVLLTVSAITDADGRAVYSLRVPGSDDPRAFADVQGLAAAIRRTVRSDKAVLALRADETFDASSLAYEILEACAGRVLDVEIVDAEAPEAPRGDALQLLVEAVENEGPETGSVAAWAIGGLGPAARPALGTLYRVAGGDHRGMRAAATWAVGRIEAGK